MHAIIAAHAFTPHTSETARGVIALIVGAIVIFRQRLLYLVATAIVILFAVAVVVGMLTLAQLMH
ncbi:MAG TPA: hypothetical protein VHZ33_21305 [Trebonia sp.]|jgi:hypothetical protein|nr:hypothetical protein [Trebonia sp.]